MAVASVPLTTSCPPAPLPTSPFPFIFGISELTARDILNMYVCMMPSIHRPGLLRSCLGFSSRTATRLVCTSAEATPPRLDSPEAAVEIDAWPRRSAFVSNMQHGRGMGCGCGCGYSSSPGHEPR